MTGSSFYSFIYISMVGIVVFWFVSSMRFHFFFPSGDSLGCTTAVTGTHENNHSSRNRMQRTYQTLCDSVLLFNMNHKCLRWDWKRLRDEAKFFSLRSTYHCPSWRWFTAFQYKKWLTHGWGTKSIPSVVCSVIPPCREKRSQQLEQNFE